MKLTPFAALTNSTISKPLQQPAFSGQYYTKKEDQQPVETKITPEEAVPTVKRLMDMLKSSATFFTSREFEIAPDKSETLTITLKNNPILSELRQIEPKELDIVLRRDEVSISRLSLPEKCKHLDEYGQEKESFHSKEGEIIFFLPEELQTSEIGSKQWAEVLDITVDKIEHASKKLFLSINEREDVINFIENFKKKIEFIPEEKKLDRQIYL